MQLLVAFLIGWFQRGQAEIIEYLREENRVLKGQLGGKRVILTDDERRRLAVLGAAWPCGWRPRIRAGATPAFKAR